MIEALNSPVIQVESLRTKFDTTVVSNSLIALLDYSYEEARFLQQLHYWSHSKYGVVIDGIRWIYKSVREWLVEVLAGMSEWKLRKAIASLLSKGLIRREKLFAKHQQQEYKSFWWQPRNQTYYYSIDYEELEKLIATTEVDKIPQNAEIVRFENSTELSVEEIKSTKFCDLSQNRSKNINQKKITTRQSDREIKDRDNIAAAFSETTLEKEEPSKNSDTSSSQLSTFPDRTDSNLSSPPQSNRRNKNASKVEHIINKRWKESIFDLDGVGIPINKTLKDFLKRAKRKLCQSPRSATICAYALLRERR